MRVKIGDRYGRLTVVGEAPRRGKTRFVRCRCDCGNVIEVRAASLTKSHQPTRSCGCLQKEIVGEIGKRTMTDNCRVQVEMNIRLNTNTQVLKTKTPPKNNTSGHKGVCWGKSARKWVAYLTVHGHRIWLGKYDRYEDAVEAREDAEKEYFEPLLKEAGII